MNAQYDRVEYTTKETAAALRRALREAFPGVRFSVRMARGTAYGWLDVAYVDGPTWEQVRAISNGFQSQTFDGRDDFYKSIEPTLYAREDGSLYEVRWSCCGINSQRTYSPEVQAWAATVAVPGSYWWPRGVAAWRDNPDAAVRDLLSGLDLTHGLPEDPRAVWKDRWQRTSD